MCIRDSDTPRLNSRGGFFVGWHFFVSRSLFADDRGSGRDNSDCRNKYGDYIGFGFQTCFPRLFVIVRRGRVLGCPFLLPPCGKGLGREMLVGNRPVRYVMAACILSVERRVVKTVCRLFCRGFGKMARVYELLLLRRSLGRYRGKSGYSAMTPDPTSSSPSYQAANCPGVIPR